MNLHKHQLYLLKQLLNDSGVYADVCYGLFSHIPFRGIGSYIRLNGCYVAPMIY